MECTGTLQNCRFWWVKVWSSRSRASIIESEHRRVAGWEFPKIGGGYLRVPLKGYYKGTIRIPLKGSIRDVWGFPKIRGTLSWGPKKGSYY